MEFENLPEGIYRGRIAPTPTGFLHLGHAKTFSLAAARCRAVAGTLVLRIEDIDRARCKTAFAKAAMEDLRALGITWQEGPDVGGNFAPYVQSEAMEYFLSVWRRLRDAGAIYPCRRSRKDVAAAARAPHAEDDAEAIFPMEWRPEDPDFGKDFEEPGDWNWRFRVPAGESICFRDALQGEQRFVAGTDFGDFVVWRRDGVPAYELAVVADDIRMKITEVVRGADLLKSTARQLLLYRALNAFPPAFAHAPLVLDASGKRLAKRNDALSVRALLARGEKIV
ncbi:MAG: tRNA glutamyl-Q synthetase [Opitutales bacterium]|nr:tRNA glutamyl-Q synthetase [Opitutales bacterium]